VSGIHAVTWATSEPVQTEVKADTGVGQH
jgi:hypothetical protein